MSNAQLQPSRSSAKVVDDVTTLTSYNPFSEDEYDHSSSYTFVSALFSRVKNSFSTHPSTSTHGSHGGAGNSTTNGATTNTHETRPPLSTANSNAKSTSSTQSKPKDGRMPLRSFATSSSSIAPPLLSYVPAISEIPLSTVEVDKYPSRSSYMSPMENHVNNFFGNSIPGFPIQDDSRSIHTAASLRRSGSVSKVIRKIRGEGTHLCV